MEKNKGRGWRRWHQWWQWWRMQKQRSVETTNSCDSIAVTFRKYIKTGCRPRFLSNYQVRASLFSFARYYLYELPSIFIFIIDFRSFGRTEAINFIFLPIPFISYLNRLLINIFELYPHSMLWAKRCTRVSFDRTLPHRTQLGVKFARSFFVPCVPFVFFPSFLCDPLAHKASYAYRAIIVIDRDEGAKESGGRAPTRRVCGIPLRSLHRIILSVGRSIDFAKSEQDRRRSREPSHSKDIR